ncbi:MAG: secretin N-terminal domain-containing protein [Puniceicoccaceae bacterium]
MLRILSDALGNWGKPALACMCCILAASASSNAQEADAGSGVDSLILSAQPADQVLDLLEELTGKAVLRQGGLPNPALSLQVREPLSREEAVMALESLLKLNGIAVIGSGERFLKAVPVEQAVRQVPELIVTSTLDRPPTEKVFAALFTTEYLDPEEARTVVQPVLSSDNVTELTRENGLLVTDSLINLQRAETLLRKLDAPREMKETVLFFQLRNVSADDTAQRLTSLRDGPLGSYFGPSSAFLADANTNQLLVITNPANSELVRSLIEKLDRDVEPLTDSRVFHIKHAQAEEIVALIESLISSQQQGSEDLFRKAIGEEAVESEDAPVEVEIESEEAAEGEAGPPRDPIDDIGEQIGLESKKLRFSPFASLVSDERSNAIVAYGTDKDLEFIASLIEQIDTLLPQVRIEVIIAEVTLNNNKVRGFDAFGIRYNTEGDFEIGLAEGRDGNEMPLEIGGLTLSGLAVKDFSLEAVFRAAEDDGDVTVLSSPTIVTTHNKEATINVSETRPVVTGTVTGDTGISSRSTVDFRDIGIQLIVTPLIGNNGIIQMEIDQQVDNVVRVITGTGNPDLDGQPIIGTRKAQSFLAVGDRDVIVLGGLKERSETYSRRRLAVLGHIPFLGNALFTRRELEQQDRELVIFIKPFLIESPLAAREDAMRHLDRSLNQDDVRDFLETGDFERGDFERLRDTERK